MQFRCRASTTAARVCLLFAVLLPVACDDDPAAPEPAAPVLTVDPVHQWAGGEVRITIVGFPFEEADVVVVGEDTLEVFDRQLFLLGVRLPADADGLTTIEVLRDGERIGSVTAEAYGFEEMRVYPSRLAHYITEYPVEFGVAVVGPAYQPNEDTNLGITWIHPSTGTWRQFEGTPNVEAHFRTGVDPASGVLYYEWQYGPDRLVHAGRIVGGELEDLGWHPRPCDEWGCEPLIGDRWITYDPVLTCQVVQGPLGESCERIAGDPLGSGETQWIQRLWSADVIWAQNWAFRMSTGEFAYRLPVDHPSGGFWPGFFKATPDESLGLFHVSSWGRAEDTATFFLQIRRVRGADGSVIRLVNIPLGLDPDEELHAPGGPPDLDLDAVRDVILLHRTDKGTLEVRDAETLELRGEVVLQGYPDAWMESRLFVDQDTDRAFIVYSAAWQDRASVPGTPVISIRLPPP